MSNEGMIDKPTMSIEAHNKPMSNEGHNKPIMC